MFSVIKNSESLSLSNIDLWRGFNIINLGNWTIIGNPKH